MKEFGIKILTGTLFIIGASLHDDIKSLNFILASILQIVFFFCGLICMDWWYKVKRKNEK
jgi:hypothetical protein